MSLDNIQLPATVLQDLYKNALIDLKSGNVPCDSSAAGSIAFLGNNKKGVVIIVKDANAIYLSDDTLGFLMGILKACALSMDDIGLVNLAKNGVFSYTGITSQLDAEKVFLFGVAPAEIELPLQFPYYQVQQYDGRIYLSAPDLHVLEHDKTEKLKLWACLKQVFAI